MSTSLHPAGTLALRVQHPDMGFWEENTYPTKVHPHGPLVYKGACDSEVWRPSQQITDRSTSEITSCLHCTSLYVLCAWANLLKKKKNVLIQPVRFCRWSQMLPCPSQISVTSHPLKSGRVSTSFRGDHSEPQLGRGISFLERVISKQAGPLC